MTTSRRAESKTDWHRIKGLSDDAIELMAANDPDNPGTTAADWADSVIGLRPLKTAVNAKFDVDVVDWFRSQGRGYRARMNAVLRRYMDAHRKAG